MSGNSEVHFALPFLREIVVDNFAGGGGASTGIERAIRRCVDEALNHDPKALAMHRANHANTRHHCEDIRIADPSKIAAGRPVGLAWFSPDCKHFSKAKGGKPRDKNIRGLAWVVVNWVNKVSPRVIILENVEEFQTWGPVDREGNPKKRLAGWFFQCFVGALRRRGYVVEHRELRACDYGAPTIRKRFFLIARRDGRPIVWPEPTHGPGRPRPHRAVAECIDFTIPCPSIFSSAEEIQAQYGIRAKRPLAPATEGRIAKGIEKFVLQNPSPFIACLTHQDGGRATVKLGCLTRYNVGAVGGDLNKPINTICVRAGRGRTGGNGFGLVECKAAFATYGQHGGHNRAADEPCHTICANSKDTNQLVECRFAAAHITKLRGTNIGHSGESPLHTVTAGGTHHALTCCYVAQQNLGAVGRAADKPLSTLTASGSQQQLVSCALATNTTGHAASGVHSPAPTITTGGQQMLLSAYLVPYYGSEKDGQAAEDPCRTITTKERFALAETFFEVEPLTPEKAEKARAVAAWLRAHGVDVPGEFATAGGLVIWDIGLRMLKPAECYRAQGFPEGYVIDRGLAADGADEAVCLTTAEQMRMCGNSVCPPLAEALVAANYNENDEWIYTEAA